MNDASASIRVILFERDEPTDTRSVLDIREFDTPSTPTPRTWTELAKDQSRRQLIMDLVLQIDQLASGHVDEVSLVLRR